MDTEVLSSVLGQVDVEAIKRESQTDIQHPIYSPIYEQREEFIQMLTTLSVRQFVAKTADDRLALLWAERVEEPNGSVEDLEGLIISLSKRHGAKTLSPSPHAHAKAATPTGDGIFSS